jgi:replicative DNA helicase
MLDERIPPNDTYAEAAVLSAVFLQVESLAEIVPILQKEHFYADAHQRIYEALLELDQESKPIDILTVKAWLEDRDQLARVGGTKYLAEIIDAVPAISNVEVYAKRVKDKWRLRQLIDVCRRVAAEGYGQIDDVPEFIDAAEQAVFELSGDETKLGPESARVIVKREFEDLQTKLTQGAVERVKTGFDGIDDVLVGLEDGKLVIVAARPGVGKTALFDQWAWNVAKKGDGVLLFTMEMKRGEQASRILWQQARVNSRIATNRPKDLTPEDWQNLAVTGRELSGLPLLIDDESGLTLPSLRAKSRRAASQMARDGVRLRVVGVDYLQLMEAVGKADNREQQVASLSRGLKRLAGDLNLCVVCLCQLNRASVGQKNSRPQLHNLRESGAIEQDADQVVFIHRESDESTVAEAIIAKGRAYGGGTVKLRWTKEFSRFDTLAEGEEDEEEADW